MGDIGGPFVEEVQLLWELDRLQFLVLLQEELGLAELGGWYSQ